MRFMRSASFFKNVDGSPVFQHKAVLYANGSKLFLACIKQDVRDNEIKLNLLNGEEILLDEIYPPFDSRKFTEARIQPFQSQFIKRPDLMSYRGVKEDGDIEENRPHIRDNTFLEVKMMQVIKRTPHQNIVKFHGCVVEDGRIVGLCLQKCPENLKDRLGKKKIVDSKRVLKELNSAVSHLHSLGYSHNDIHPGNIMFGENGGVVLSDFDYAGIIGVKLGHKTRNDGFETKPSFSLPNMEFSDPKNDLYALKKVQQHIEMNQSK